MDSQLIQPMSEHKVNVSKLLYEIDMPELQCKFYVYNLTRPLESGIRLYVQIEYARTYAEVYYIPYMDVTYTVSEYKEFCSTKEALAENLSYHFLAAHIMTRELDEYFH